MSLFQILKIISPICTIVGGSLAFIPIASQSARRVGAFLAIISGLFTLYLNFPRKEKWTGYKKEFLTLIPPFGKPTFVNFQYQLYCSGFFEVPLKMRIAADTNGGYAQELSGSAGTVEQLVLEAQTIYVSVPSPNIKYELKVLGFKDPNL
jgi:hypothetical protein